MEMETICAWCQEKIKDKETGKYRPFTSVKEKTEVMNGEEISHGICPECHEKNFQELTTNKAHSS